MQNKYAENAPTCPDRIGRSDMQKIEISDGGIRTFLRRSDTRAGGSKPPALAEAYFYGARRRQLWRVWR